MAGTPLAARKVEDVASLSKNSLELPVHTIVNLSLLKIHVQHLVISSKLISSNQKKKSHLQHLANSSNLKGYQLKMHVQRHRHGR